VTGAFVGNGVDNVGGFVDSFKIVQSDHAWQEEFSEQEMAAPVFQQHSDLLQSD